MLDNTQIQQLNTLISPEQLRKQYPQTNKTMSTVYSARQNVIAALKGKSNKRIVVVGPCSIHDPKAALEYAAWLKSQMERYGDRLQLIMRVYFEKPRTTLGWKGYINDPHLDGGCDINEGLVQARRLLLAINQLGVPTATELLDPNIAVYLEDLIAWGAIGARTSASQIHREMVSGLSMPVGFKNDTSGNVQIAVNAITAAQGSHQYMRLNRSGQSAIYATRGNANTHVILRGGDKKTNYDAASVQHTCELLTRAGKAPKVMIDCSHGNSQKDHRRQAAVACEVVQQMAVDGDQILGVMLESHLVAGRQDLILGQKNALTYGQSITDACMDCDMTSGLLQLMHGALKTVEVAA